MPETGVPTDPHAPSIAPSPAPTSPDAPTAPAAPEAGVPWDTLKAQIPADLRSEKVWESVKDFGGLAKQFVEGQKMIGSSVRVPKDDAPQAVWDSFYQKVGRPESADGYQFPLPELPDGQQWNDGAVAAFKKAAHGLGFTPRQAQGVMAVYSEMVRGAAREQARAGEAQIEGLRSEWGAAFDNNLAIAKSATRQLFGQKFIDMLNRTGLGNDPDMIRGMLRVGKDLMEDGVIDAGEGYSSLGSVKDEINKVLSLSPEDRKTHPYWNELHPDHKDAVERMYRLQEVLANTAA